jgi:hypothetical protein
MTGRVISLIECEGDDNYLLKIADSPDSTNRTATKKLEMGEGETFMVHALSDYLLTPRHLRLVREALIDVQRYHITGSWVYLQNGKVVNTGGGKKKK